MRLQREINTLRKEKNAAILAHNYQLPAVQQCADFTGDSLELARKAQQTDANLIVFAGVSFMAETAKILNPEKKVLLAAKDAACPMAGMLHPEKLLQAKKRYPKAETVLYVNSSADCKALADCCCTSANAVEVANAMQSSTVLLGPDRNLAYYVDQRSDKSIVPVPADGFCYVHRFIGLRDLQQARKVHKNALAIVHPECNPEVQAAADAIGSTSQMIKIAAQSNAEEFLIGTEREMCYRLSMELPGKKFFPIRDTAVCSSMKKTDLQTVFNALKKEQFEVKLGKEIIEKSKKAIDAMLGIK